LQNSIAADYAVGVGIKAWPVEGMNRRANQLAPDLTRKGGIRIERYDKADVG
jgi:hypothetical protein